MNGVWFVRACSQSTAVVVLMFRCSGVLVFTCVMLNLAKNQLWSDGQSIISGCRLNRALFAKSASVPFTWSRGGRWVKVSWLFIITWIHSWVCVCVCVYLHHRSRQDDVSAERTLRVVALLSAVISLSQRHGQRRLRVHLQDRRHRSASAFYYSPRFPYVLLNIAHVIKWFLLDFNVFKCTFVHCWLFIDPVGV